jgi:RimJ/RimL family protein N-acetyltransferase
MIRGMLAALTGPAGPDPGILDVLPQAGCDLNGRFAMSRPAIRLLNDADRWRLRPHFKQLGAEDRRLRFGATLNDAAIDRYVDLIDFDRDAVFGAPDADGDLIAVAHVAPIGDGAELGLSVRDGARGAGLGGALFAEGVAWARNRYLGRIYMHCLRENRAILRLAVRNGMLLESDGAESTAVLRLPEPDLESWTREQATHWNAAAENLADLEARWFDWALTGPRIAAEAFARSLESVPAKAPTRAY